jgi:riboflavin biosynthesis pyrimidine reductase
MVAPYVSRKCGGGIMVRMVLFILANAVIQILIGNVNLDRYIAITPLRNTSAMDPSTTTKITNILHQLQCWQNNHTHTSPQKRPFVTVAFAQSIDGYMAPYQTIIDGSDTKDDRMIARTTSNFPLSGEESLLLTHALRSIHDGIMIGGRTLWIDNPRLTNRLWGTRKVNNTLNDTQYQPQPIILDPNLRYIRKVGRLRNVKNPIVCCSYNATLSRFDDNWESTHNIRLLKCQCYDDGTFNMSDVLYQLHHCYRIRCVMVEGGAHTLSTLFTSNVVDAIIITIVPKLLHHGIRPMYETITNKWKLSIPYSDLLLPTPFCTLGNDANLIAKLEDI